MASAQVFDNFESGLSDKWVQSSPNRWSADTAATLAGEYSLRHSFDNPEAGSDMIAIPVVNLHPDEGLTSWSFILRHGYDPSSSNNWSVSLFSDRCPASLSADGETSGFAVGVNLTGYDDTLRLWKVRGTVNTPVINSGINWQTEVGISEAVKITVERSEDGKWKLSVYRLGGDLINSVYGIDPELFESSWFGIYYKYSSSRDRLLWIDDISIEGIFYADTLPPAITDCRVCGRNSIEIMLSEEADSSFSTTDNFYLNTEDNKPLSVVRKGDLHFVLQFAGEFINKAVNNLLVRCLCDKTGNESRDTVILFTPVWAERGDIIVSEIMADPLPAVSLPGREYIEITNRTEFSFDLKDWKLISGDQKIYFPPVIVGPHEVQIICQEQDTILFRDYGKTIGLKQFPMLTDDGKLICMCDTNSYMIHGVEYSGRWYGNELKSQGGWSLEMIDTSVPFHFEGNWTASSSRKGGTPGTVNSVSGANPDLCFIGILNIFPDNNTIIICSFSEPVGDFSGLRNGVIPDGPDIKEVYSNDLFLSEFKIQLSEPLIYRTIYKIEFPDELTDFAGNQMENSSFEFGLAETPSGGDIRFNELLFNPFPGDPDYIELFNCSDKIIDASRLYLVYVNDATADTSVPIAVSQERRCIMPGIYYTVTTDRQKIIDRYPSTVPENLFVIPSLPSMPDDNATLLLFSSELDILDKVTYSEEMHFQLLSGFEGVALENTGSCNLPGDIISWHSASEISGWGTPGGPNSVNSELISQAGKISLSSTKITPDSDGFEDLLLISMSLDGIDNAVSVSVFDETGSLVKKIAVNTLTGAEAAFSWDGTADDGSPVNSGIYIILISMFDEKGKTERWKKVCTVLR